MVNDRLLGCQSRFSKMICGWLRFMYGAVTCAVQYPYDFLHAYVISLCLGSIVNFIWPISRFCNLIMRVYRAYDDYFSLFGIYCLHAYDDYFALA
jgi:hypothetical protein